MYIASCLFSCTQASATTRVFSWATMEGYSYLAGLMHSTWDASQFYLGQGVHSSAVYSAALDGLRTEVEQYVVILCSPLRELSLSASKGYSLLRHTRIPRICCSGFAAGASRPTARTLGKREEVLRKAHTLEGRRRRRDR